MSGCRGGYIYIYSHIYIAEYNIYIYIYIYIYINDLDEERLEGVAGLVVAEDAGGLLLPRTIRHYNIISNSIFILYLLMR